MSAIRSWSIFVLVTLSALPTQAATPEERARAARKACLTGDVDKGVDLLADLFLDTRDINHIFNQGRCFEQNRRFAEAISRFQEFLVKGKNLGEEEKADAQKHIDLCRANLDPQSGSKPPAEPAPRAADSPRPESDARSSTLAPETSLGLVTKRQASDEKPAGTQLRTLGVVAVAVGAAAGITGLILNLKYNSMTHGLEGDYYASTASSSTTYKSLSQVGYVAGGVCVAAGALIYYLGWRQGQTVLAPAAVAGNGGIVVEGVF